MNKYFYKCLVVIAMLGIVSCEEQLELVPFNSVPTEEALESNTDFTNAIRGVYSRFRQTTYYGGWEFIMGDVLADNVIISSEGRTSKQNYFYYNVSGNITWSGLWTNAYKVINRANLILENIEALPEGTFRKNIEGEALALRALAHYNLARTFAPVPAYEKPEDLGIPYVTSSDAGNKPARPETAKETYDKIIADLVAAELLINENNGTGRLNKASVNGLLSRVYLVLQDWDKTIATASKALEMSSGITSRTEFPKIWLDETEKGVLFKVIITEQDGDDIGTEYSQTGPTGIRSEYVVDYAFFQTFSNDDIRKSTYIKTSNFAGNTFNHIAKYFGRAVGSLNVVDAKVLRTAEVLLNRAEAYAMKGNDVAALADLNLLRSNRYSNFTAGTETGAALLDEILEERRKELAFEGYRFWDLKRRNEAVVRSAFGDLANGGGLSVPEDKRFLSSGSSIFILPIPQDELNANPNMKQNPGY